MRDKQAGLRVGILQWLFLNPAVPHPALWRLTCGWICDSLLELTYGKHAERAREEGSDSPCRWRKMGREGEKILFRRNEPKMLLKT
ncbi:MAG: hypothetical protein WBO19_17245, partial [Terriglobia bacterium]